MVILLFCVELEVLDELAAPDRGQVMREAARAYRNRAAARRLRGRQGAAQADLQRAMELEADAARITAAAR